ncbi:MAG: hypothetical protein A2073_08115 [Deltaproteobacteria bacterium GWC2_42_11]|nr:MAG: hypothetical protein A2073_08115 [Deltaproteobacteria bacterium GWC2_42_11]HBO84943.1 hypothetical protein [Deltaproteobacteria bacterium]
MNNVKCSVLSVQWLWVKGFLPLLLLITLNSSLITILAGCASKQVDKIPAVKQKAVDLNYAGVKYSDNYNKALKNFERALIINKKIDNRTGIVVNELNIARTYIAEGRYETAFPFIKEAVDMAESESDVLLLSEAYATISNYYYLNGDYNKSLSYIEKGIDIDKHHGLSSVGGKLNLKALVYKATGEADKSMEVINEALKQNESGNNRRGVADTYRVSGSVMLSGKKYDDAVLNFEKALAIDKELARGRAIALDLTGLANVYVGKGEYRKAIDYLKKAYDVNAANSYKENALADIDRIIETATLLGDTNIVRIFSEERERFVSDSNLSVGRGLK